MPLPGNMPRRLLESQNAPHPLSPFNPLHSASLASDRTATTWSPTRRAPCLATATFRRRCSTPPGPWRPPWATAASTRSRYRSSSVSDAQYREVQSVMEIFHSNERERFAGSIDCFGVRSARLVDERGKTRSMGRKRRFCRR